MRSVIMVLLGGLLPAGDLWAQSATAPAAPPASASMETNLVEIAQSNGDVTAGRKVAGMCRTCHGLEGMARIPIAPHIGGETVEYLMKQLHAFKSGEREHEMMSVVARGLSDAQIKDVATWFNHFEVSATLPPGKTEDDAPQLCVACHGANGISELPEAPNLAAETNIYIETQIKAFRTGKRVHDVMTPIAKDLTDTEMQKASDWYSKIDLKITDPLGK